MVGVGVGDVVGEAVVVGIGLGVAVGVSVSVDDADAVGLGKMVAVGVREAVGVGIAVSTATVTVDVLVASCALLVTCGAARSSTNMKNNRVEVSLICCGFVPTIMHDPPTISMVMGMVRSSSRPFGYYLYN